MSTFPGVQVPGKMQMSCASQLPRQGWAESQSHLPGPRPHTLTLHSSWGVLVLKLGRGRTNRSLCYPRSSSLLEVFQSKTHCISPTPKETNQHERVSRPGQQRP